MNNVHQILCNIPHEHIQSQYVMPDERFDVFKLGIFEVQQSILNSITGKPDINESVEEIVELVELQPNSIYRPHYHHKSAAIIYIVLGEGKIVHSNRKIPYIPGKRFTILANQPHGFITDTRTLFLSIQSPPICNRITGEVDLHYVQES